MSATHLPNRRRGLNVSGDQTGAPMVRIADGTFRPLVKFKRRLESPAVGPDSPGYHDQSALDSGTGSQAAKQFLGLLDEHGLLYKYTPISSTEIRLLFVNPARRYEDDIFVEIVALDEHEAGLAASQQAYEALSYHWGPGPADKPVYIYGEESNTRVENADRFSLSKIVPDHAKGLRAYVRPNLDKALRSLRNKTEVIVLWVDAICINQDDEIVEKPAQIAKMKDIYNKAFNVCIWLGDGKESIDEDRSDDFHNAMAFSCIISYHGEHEVLLHGDYAKDWSDLLDLMQCSWFSRRWVIQELASAREATVHCGTACLAWKEFATAISVFALKFDKIMDLFALSRNEKIYRNFTKFNKLKPFRASVLVDAITDTFRKNVDGTVLTPVFSLETLVSSLASFESSDPRDSIFALLNIAEESMFQPSNESNMVGPPKVNYERDLLEVYTDFLEWVVHSTGSLDIICRQWATPERRKFCERKHTTGLVTLPSWIQTIAGPTWGTQGRGLNGESLVGGAGRRRYNASYGKNPEVRFGARRRVVGVPPKRANWALAAPGSAIPSSCSTINTAYCPARDTTSLPYMTPSHRLHAKGIVIGAVKWCSNPTANGVITRTCFERGGWTFDGQPKHEVPDKLWRTMVADRDADGNSTPRLYPTAALHAMTFTDNKGDLATQELIERGGTTSRT